MTRGSFILREDLHFCLCILNRQHKPASYSTHIRTSAPFAPVSLHSFVPEGQSWQIRLEKHSNLAKKPCHGYANSIVSCIDLVVCTLDLNIRQRRHKLKLGQVTEISEDSDSLPKCFKTNTSPLYLYVRKHLEVCWLNSCFKFVFISWLLVISLCVLRSCTVLYLFSSVSSSHKLHHSLLRKQ